MMSQQLRISPAIKVHEEEEYRVVGPGPVSVQFRQTEQIAAARVCSSLSSDTPEQLSPTCLPSKVSNGASLGISPSPFLWGIFAVFPLVSVCCLTTSGTDTKTNWFQAGLCWTRTDSSPDKRSKLMFGRKRVQE